MFTCLQFQTSKTVCANFSKLKMVRHGIATSLTSHPRLHRKDGVSSLPHSSPTRRGGFWVNKVIILARKSSRRGLLGRQNLNFSEKIVPQGPLGQIKLVFWARRSTRRGLLGGWNYILSRKSVPQGPFGWVKLYFELEKRPAGTGQRGEPDNISQPVDPCGVGGYCIDYRFNGKLNWL